MNSYELSRAWFNFSFDNPELIKPIHSAIFFFAIEHCNRLGGKEKFGFPSQMTMEAIGVKNHQTYSKGLNDLANWGFITFIEKSKNQYSANIIKVNATTKNGKARNKALDKAFIKHKAKQSESTTNDTVDIDKPINQLTNKPINQGFNFRNELLNISQDKQLVNDFLEVRKNKKASNTKTALNLFLNQVEKSGKDLNYILKICIEKDWKSFKVEWMDSNKKISKDTSIKIVETDKPYKLEL